MNVWKASALRVGRSPRALGEICFALFPGFVYTPLDKDVARPFIEQVPKDCCEKASLKRLSYTSATELLAEKFHMSERVLQQLNPNVAFDQAGTEIVVCQHRARRAAGVDVQEPLASLGTHNPNELETNPAVG